MSSSDDIQLRVITREDVEFLAGLQEEMNTQPHQCQADPRFWVVMTHEYREAVDGEDIERVTFYDEGGDIASMSLDDAMSAAYRSSVEFGGVEYAESVLDGFGLYIDERGGFHSMCSYGVAVTDFVKDYAETKGASVMFETCEERIAENTMFLTLREAKEHIARNDYHYVKPHTYGMTAWRSPQVERLYEILHEVDFKRLLEVASDD